MRRWKQRLEALVLSAVTAMALAAEARARDGTLLFYNEYTGAAVTGRVDADGSYTDLKTYSGFDFWTHVVPTATGRVLYYNWTTGAAVLGEIDAQGAYTDGPLIQLASYWTHIVSVR